VSLVVYTYLYDATVAWYAAQRYSAGRYVHFFAVTTLSSMALVNIGSLVALSAHWNAGWARQLIAAMDPLLVVLAGMGLLTTHILFSGWRRRALASQPSSAPPSRWIALAYIVLSVVVFMYTSSLLPLAHL
jgi:hypothetical protein